MSPFTIRTETITNENLEILFRFRFRNGKANKFPQIFFRICFRNTVATEIKVKLIPREYFVAFAFAMILIGQMILRIQVHIETSPRIWLSLSLS